ncbi:unnamed protein product [Toxocara canis]|uniref:Uncharacterized protein n=1 Tax=Toxocara canis TaxID=6265 RepID=A0A183UPY2_TOXCA|nr:unnamed protein product [Toxocara canis]
MANASELPTLSTIPQSGSKACNGSKTLNGFGSQANNGSNTCNGSKTCNGCGLCNDGSKMANVNGADVSLPNVDITMLSNIRRSAIASENCAAEDKTCSEDQTTPPSAIVQTPLDNLVTLLLLLFSILSILTFSSYFSFAVQVRNQCLNNHR